MNNPRVQYLLENLEGDFNQVLLTVDAFTSRILQWADELSETSEKGFSGARESPVFLLPKTPSEKRTRTRKARNALVSKCSVLNSTVSNRGVSILNDTISTRTRTRAASRAASSKISQLNITKDKEVITLDIERENIKVENVEKFSEATFVIPQALKPGLENTEEEEAVPEIPKRVTRASRSRVPRTLSRSTRGMSKAKKMASIPSEIPVEEESPEIFTTAEGLDQRPSRNKTLKVENPIVNESPEERPSRKKVSGTSNGSPEERRSRKKVSGTSSGSPPERQSKRKISRALSESPAERQSRRKISRTLSGSPVVRGSTIAVPDGPERIPMVRTSSIGAGRKSGGSSTKRPSSTESGRKSGGSSTKRSSSVEARRMSGTSPATGPTSGEAERMPGRSPTTRQSRNTLVPQNSTFVVNGKKESEAPANRTVTIKKKAMPSFIISHEEVCESGSFNGEDVETPRVMEERFSRIRRTSTPLAKGNQSPKPSVMEQSSPDLISDENENVSRVESVGFGAKTNATFSVAGVKKEETFTSEKSDENPVPKKRKKTGKAEESLKENVEEEQSSMFSSTVRITRTKSKAMKQMIEDNETKQADLSAFAKKILNRAKMTSLKKNQLAVLLEKASSTPKNGPAAVTLPFGNLTSKSKYHLLLLSSTKKSKTPLATLPNSAVVIVNKSEDKNRPKPKIGIRDSSVENAVRSAAKPQKNDFLEKEMKLKSKKEKVEEVAMKRQIVIKNKQEELKRKNELKHQMAMKQREKLELEKYNNMIQSEKEKEERHKLILQERQMKVKEEAFKKKMLTQQKIAETNERRRLEEEARIAKLKEMEAEEQRLALEKQREQERQEKRAQERLAQKKAREEYEMQLKQELEAERLRVEKMSATKKYLQSASKMQSASKRPKFGLTGEKREWDYKPRNENDYGLDGEDSEEDSGDEKFYGTRKAPVVWAEKILKGNCELVKILTLEMMCEYMPCYQKSPDIHKMFKMTPSKRIKRTSSAIWNTPTS